MLLSVIIPCYNEIKTIEKIVELVSEVKINKEIIIVDDCSNDGTTEFIRKNFEKKIAKTIYHKNQIGKGGCIKSACKIIKGDIVIIQDADLEYDPNDYYALIKPILEKQTKVVYGSRFLGEKYENTNFISKWRIFGNKFLTNLSNFINNQNLTDAHTCYKVFSRDVFDNLNLKKNDFSFCPEVTTKISNMNIEIIEVPIKYFGRSKLEGKKISWTDAIIAILAIIRFKFFK